MSDRDRLLEQLRALVACDTRNPPRANDGISALFSYAGAALRDARFTVHERDLGEGCRWLYASRGSDEAVRAAPLVNVHIDTVPLAEGWSCDPFDLRVDVVDGEERATGLGACDIKGAVAAYLVAAADVRGPTSLLLSSDEEAGSSRCVRTFVAEHDVVGRLLLVAEPTQGKAVVAHRGIGTAVATFDGEAGHASLRRSIETSALTRAVRFCAGALDELAGPNNENRLNLGRIEGGTKANMIATSCVVRLGVRPPPETTPKALVARMGVIAKTVCGGHARVEPGFLAPALPAQRDGRTVDAARASSTARARALGLTIGDDVDFFTEAAFFSAAGADAVVFGSGDIAQAHTADEWVRVRELNDVAAAYRRIIGDAP